MKSLFDISRKIILITGGLGNLSRGCAESFLRSGAAVILVDLPEQLKSHEDWIESKKSEYGPQRFIIKACDITKKGEIQRLGMRLQEQPSSIPTTLVNNACARQVTVIDGVNLGFENFPLEEWEMNLSVNLTGAFLITQMLVPLMLKTDSGANIINIGSTYGIVGCDQRIYGNSGINSSIAYATTKAGLQNFTRYLSSYYRERNFRANVVNPGGIYNKQPAEFVERYISRTTSGCMGDIDDVIGMLHFLVSDASKWVNGASLMVDGGWTAT